MNIKEEKWEVPHWDDNNIWLGNSPMERALMDKAVYLCSNEGKHICRGINRTGREVIIPKYSMLVVLRLE